MWKHLVAAAVFIAFFSSHAFPGENELKWGKVSKAEINLVECEFEPGVDAVVLNDLGVLKIASSNVVITRHRRIKILHENGLDQGNIEIPFYTKDGWETVKNVRAQTININEGGKLERIKIPADKIYQVDKSNHWKAIRFTFPAIKKGSIIEYSYVTYSKNFTFLDGWIFQSEIPTLQSSFTALIPESMDYRILFEGKRLLQKYGGQRPVNKWSIDNVFSIKDEPFVANYLDYAEKIRFQLAGYKRTGNVPGSIEYVTTMTTWEKLAKERLQDVNYSSFLLKSGKANEILETIGLQGQKPIERIKSIYNYVKDTYTWNARYRLFTRQSFNEFLKTKVGNNAEINLLLSLLLKNAGFEANPVLLSTRKHGKVTRSYPFLSQFNYLICNVNLDGRDILMDATNPKRPYSLLSKSCLNEFGYLLDKRNPRWISIKPDKHTSETILVDAVFDENGNVTSRVNLKYNGYKALAFREKFEEDDFADFLDSHLEIDDLSLKDIKQEHQDQLDKPYEFAFTISSNDEAVRKNELIYFHPVLINNHKENPFKSDLRHFPVDYSYPFKENYILLSDIPDSFEIVEIPEDQKMSLPDNLGSFIYVSQLQGNRYHLSVDFRINKATIPTEYYPVLQKFYNIMIAKLKEIVVLKKIN
ncbi:DUF3857 domain-containing protein [Fulvivirgaceae bacterium BMA12]|uniref:DUF3857 domain-containing protein n=1 Tax=Agaribacillus aureus TaxID=3051825 RepID=A0ABT8L043_9BACT|nr:DUF3857 domain-containing protein [Fulvivirgaceae bacterium BMA12]